MAQTQKSGTTTDVLIVGGGPVGLTLGVALARSGFETAVVDALDPKKSVAADFDGRVSSIAFASCRMLQALDIWPAVEPVAQPINDIIVSDGRVSEGAAPFFLHFDHREIGDEPLGHLIENRHLRQALYGAVEREPNLTLLAPDQLRNSSFKQDHVAAEVSDGAAIKARLCLAADGRASPMRERHGIKTLSWPYRQSGIVATVAHERPHQGIAHEYFLPAGPFAILPMTGNRSSLVWAERADLAPTFMDMTEDDFNGAVADRFGSFLGPTKVIGPRWSYPLGLQLATEYVKPRFALIGDSAHAIHPIAGQGLNMGLRDVAAMAEVLTEAAQLGLDIGSLSVLERYQRWRRFDNVSLAAVTDVLNRLFSNDIGPLRLVRDLGLGLVQQLAPARQYFMRQAGGAMGQLPKLLKGEPL